VSPAARRRCSRAAPPDPHPRHEPLPTTDDVVRLVLGVGLLPIYPAGREDIEPEAHRRQTEEFQIQLARLSPLAVEIEHLEGFHGAWTLANRGSWSQGRASGPSVSARSLRRSSRRNSKPLMVLRAATADDLPTIVEIYNHEVLHGVATFDTVPWTVEGQRGWLDEHRNARHPLLVAEQDGEVIGWACLSAWSTRCAYERAAEVSVYVDQQHRGRGVGRALLTALAERARRAGVGVLLARIESSGQASLNLFRSLGFTSIGTMRRVGEKFGRILDVELLDLHLDG
jgi:L-amino acid N-acyltransferase